MRGSSSCIRCNPFRTTGWSSTSNNLIIVFSTTLHPLNLARSQDQPFPVRQPSNSPWGLLSPTLSSKEGAGELPVGFPWWLVPTNPQEQGSHPLSSFGGEDWGG